MTAIREEIIYKVGPVLPKDNDNEVINKEKNSEEEKEPKDIILEDTKLDEYFTPEQQKYYKSLYDTELYDRTDAKLVKR